ncbi:unnamed protein product [Protopolystoma xenopodis]|uniref:Cadherin domain-containing protein n=1 Tax=Protopolystoma xenopodis TaxID=117903 RepID=A0A3S5BXZ2_9PLAT|nr:unnamed protein product [Protopolystoma xenopodis]
MHSQPSEENVLAEALFTVSPTGEVYTRNTKLDREQTPVITFEVIAADIGQPELTAVVTVIVRVEDINDHAPVWLFPEDADGHRSRVNVSCYTTIGTLIAQLRAVDPDEGVSGQVRYAISKGNEAGIFSLDPNTGDLYLVKSLLDVFEKSQANEIDKFSNSVLKLDAAKQKSNEKWAYDTSEQKNKDQEASKIK